MNTLKKNVYSGFNVSCVGDNRSYSIISSKYENTISDLVLNAALIGKKNIKKYSFLERGSDERQYGSPGIDLPVIGFCRSKYGEYREYHTSADNFKVVNEKGLNGALNVLQNIVDSFELGFKPKYTIKCEPFLSSRKLYPSIGTSKYINEKLVLRMNILTYSDGKNNIYEICKILNQPLEKVLEEIKILERNNLLKIKY